MTSRAHSGVFARGADFCPRGKAPGRCLPWALTSPLRHPHPSGCGCARIPGSGGARVGRLSGEVGAANFALVPRGGTRPNDFFFSFIASWGPWGTGKATCTPGCQRTSPYPSLTQPPHTVALAVVSDASVGSCRISVREPVAWPGKRSCGILARGRHGFGVLFFPKGAWPTFDFLAPPSYSLTSPRFPATQVLRVLVRAPHGGGHP